MRVAAAVPVSLGDIYGNTPGGGAWWENLINTGGQILLRRYGTPPAGTVITQGPGGSQVITQNPSYPVTPGPITVGGTSVGFNSVLIFGGLALVAVLALGGRR